MNTITLAKLLRALSNDYDYDYDYDYPACTNIVNII